MKLAKRLRTEEIIDSLVLYSDDNESFEQNWNTFYRLTLMGFISDEDWKKVCNVAGSYTFSDGIMIDANTEEPVADWLNTHDDIFFDRYYQSQTEGWADYNGYDF